jgi:hypothetical protein
MTLAIVFHTHLKTIQKTAIHTNGTSITHHLTQDSFQQLKILLLNFLSLEFIKFGYWQGLQLVRVTAAS